MPIITENEYTFTSANGSTPIHVREWVPDCDINAVVQISHGICEYAGRYAPFARYLASKGFVVVAKRTTWATARACSARRTWAISAPSAAGRPWWRTSSSCAA